MQRDWLWVAVALLLAAPSAMRGQVVINEVMADNSKTLLNDGAYPDWIELYNTTTSPIDIGDWSFTEATNTTRQFVFPPGTLIPGRGYLVVFCDSETNSPGLHTKFNLSRKGGFVELYDKLINGGTLKNRVAFGLQISDFSVGRSPNGTGGFVLNEPTPNAANRQATLGSFMSLKINEWTATNAPPQGSTNTGKDWLELYNLDANPVQLDQLVFTSDLPLPGFPPVNRPITNLCFIGGKGFIRFYCLGKDAKARNFDELDFKLSLTSGETVTLFATDQTTQIDQIIFPGNDQVPGYWPTNGADISFGRLPDGSTNWPVRFGEGGIGKPTPEESNFAPITNVVISEVLAHTDPPLEDAVELQNVTGSPVDISGWWLSNSRDDALKFKIPAGTVLSAYGFKVFYEYVNGPAGAGFNTDGTGTNRMFTLNSARGDQVYLFTANSAGQLTGYRSGVDFGPSPNGVSFARYLTSETNKEFVLQSRLTLGTSVTTNDPPSMLSVFRTGQGESNAAPLASPLVISEIMYHPPDVLQRVFTNGLWITNHIDDSTNEYIEVYNTSGAQFALFDTNGFYYHPDYSNGVVPFADGRTNTWRLRGDTDFEFPTNLYLGPGRYLVLLNFDPTNTVLLTSFKQRFGIPDNFTRFFGPYRGKLDNSGGQVELQRPDRPQGPQNPEDFAVRLVPYYLVDQVKYNDKSPWPTNSDGLGTALLRSRPETYGNDPTNWVDATASPGRQDIIIRSPRFPPTTPTNFRFNFTAVAGSSYTVQSSEPPTHTNWTKVIDYDSQTNTSLRSVIHTNAASLPERMYRVLTPQRP